VIRTGRKCNVTPAWAHYGQLHHVSFHAGVVQMMVSFGVCSDVAEECSAFVCGEIIMAQADDEVSGKREPTNQPKFPPHQNISCM